MSKKTSLYDEHVKAGGKIVDFAGWQMPVQYEGLSQEHNACRQGVGLFDVSHMGEVLVRGKGALEFLNNLVTNDVSKIQINQAQYTVMCNSSGGCVDDLIVHKISDEEYFLCVNASNTDKDFEWIKSHASHTSGGVSVTNVSSEYSQIAIQGRHAEAILQKLSKTNLRDIKYYWFQKGSVLDSNAIIARTGYTGEDGFEIYSSWDSGPKIWSALMEAGASFGIKPCGLGARDTLRTEMKFPLYGHEIDDNTFPTEAGLSWVVKLQKANFIGKQPLEELKAKGIQKASVGLKCNTPAIPRQGYEVHKDGKVVGKITSGTLSPSLKYGVAIASLQKNLSEIGTQVDVMIRGQAHSHTVVETPFYKRNY